MESQKNQNKWNLKRREINQKIKNNISNKNISSFSATDAKFIRGFF
jgi:hypothetical protein